MAVETTINIHKEVFSQIQDVSNNTGMTKSDIIKLLISMYKNTCKPDKIFGVRVKNQERNKNSKWHRFHIRLEDHEYEYLLDLRRFCKLSVAHILVLSIKQYIGKLNSKIMMNKYPFGNYIIGKDIVDGVVKWEIFWGWPRIFTNSAPSY